MSTETAPEAITRDELAAALAELGVRINGNAYFPDLARNIFGYVGRQRREPEPEYEPGEIYESRTGYRYLRLGPGAGLSCPWLIIHRSGSAEGRPEGYPERPLRRLVPEPEPVKPDREVVAREIFDGFKRNRAPADIAARICDLLEGTDD